MTHIALTYHLDLHSALHIGTGLGFARMVDDTLCRAGPITDGGARLPYIPGSSVKGKVRSKCEALANTLGIRVCGLAAFQVDPSDQRSTGRGSTSVGPRVCKADPCILCRLFGSSYRSGTLMFSEAWLHPEWTHLTKLDEEAPQPALDPFALSSIRTGNKLERATRVVEKKLLFSLEHTAEGLGFKGSIEGHLEDRPDIGISQPLPLEGWLLAVSLLMVDKLGGGRSRGLGRCSVSITSLKVDGGQDLAPDLPGLLRAEDYPLGWSEYDSED